MKTVKEILERLAKEKAINEKELKQLDKKDFENLDNVEKIDYIILERTIDFIEYLEDYIKDFD